MTEVLSEANSPGRDKGDLGPLSGSCQIAGHRRLIEFVIGGRPPSTEGSRDKKEMKHNKGTKVAGRASGRRADRDMP